MQEIQRHHGVLIDHNELDWCKSGLNKSMQQNFQVLQTVAPLRFWSRGDKVFLSIISAFDFIL